MYLHVPTNRLHVSTISLHVSSISLHFLFLVKTTRLDPFLVKTTRLDPFLVKTTRLDPFLVKTTRLDPFLVKTTRLVSHVSTIISTSVSNNSLKSSPISMILIYMCSLHLGLKSCTICEKVWRLFYAAAFSRTKQFNTLSLFISQCDCTKQYQN